MLPAEREASTLAVLGRHSPRQLAVDLLTGREDWDAAGRLFPRKSCREVLSGTELMAPSWPCAGTAMGSDSVQGRQPAQALQSRTRALRRLLIRDLLDVTTSRLFLSWVTGEGGV